jgi:hypothetical protein
MYEPVSFLVPHFYFYLYGHILLHLLTYLHTVTCMSMPIDGVCIGNWIYSTLAERKYK